MLQRVTAVADMVTSTFTGNDRSYKMEVRKPNGEVCFYSLRALDLADARTEARSLVTLLEANDRVLWRIAGDNTWNMGANVTKRTTFKQRLKRFASEFFYIEEIEQERLQGGRR